jgi:hypothetical protein
MSGVTNNDGRVATILVRIFRFLPLSNGDVYYGATYNLQAINIGHASDVHILQRPFPETPAYCMYTQYEKHNVCRKVGKNNTRTASVQVTLSYLKIVTNCIRHQTSGRLSRNDLIGGIFSTHSWS